MSQNSFPNAGRELDALVAEKVLGWRPVRNVGRGEVWFDTGRGGAHMPPLFSDDIAAAWLLVEKLRAAGLEMRLLWTDAIADGVSSWCWTCVFERQAFRGEELDASAEADTAPVAICLAALKAVGALPHLTHGAT